MAVSKTLTLLFAVVAVVLAEEAPKDKRDVIVGAVPYAASGYVGAPGYVAAPYAAAPGYVAAPYAAAPGYVATPYAAAPGYVAAPAYVPAATAYVARPAGYVAAPAYDDGKYYPGKYEKPTFYTAPRVVV